jgi:hypothetical protein
LNADNNQFRRQASKQPDRVKGAVENLNSNTHINFRVALRISDAARAAARCLIDNCLSANKLSYAGTCIPKGVHIGTTCISGKFVFLAVFTVGLLININHFCYARRVPNQNISLWKTGSLSAALRKKNIVAYTNNNQKAKMLPRTMSLIYCNMLLNLLLRPGFASRPASLSRRCLGRFYSCPESAHKRLCSEPYTTHHSLKKCLDYNWS